MIRKQEATGKTVDEARAKACALLGCLLYTSVEGAGHLADDLLDGHGHRLGLVEDVLDGILGHTEMCIRDRSRNAVSISFFTSRMIFLVPLPGIIT